MYWFFKLKFNLFLPPSSEIKFQSSQNLFCAIATNRKSEILTCLRVQKLDHICIVNVCINVHFKDSWKNGIFKYLVWFHNIISMIATNVTGNIDRDTHLHLIIMQLSVLWFQKQTLGKQTISRKIIQTLFRYNTVSEFLCLDWNIAKGSESLVQVGRKTVDFFPHWHLTKFYIIVLSLMLLWPFGSYILVSNQYSLI